MVELVSFIPLGGMTKGFPYRGPRIFIGEGEGGRGGGGQKGSLILLKLIYIIHYIYTYYKT